MNILPEHVRTRSRQRFAAAAVPIAALLLGLAAPASGQSCDACGPRPYVCDVEISAQRSGERGRTFDPRRGLKLSGNDTVELRVDGIDQFGRRFPSERSIFGLGPGRSCRAGMLKIDDLGDGRFRVGAGSGRGECELWLWLPGNMNLEWRIPVEIRAAGVDGYSRGQAEFLGRSLYQAILGREADRDGLSSAVAEIQRGRLPNLVEAMAGSDEYRSQRAGLGASQRLDSIYQGLLGRAPDSGGVRRYLSEVERGRINSVVLDIVASEEFEGRMRREAR